MKLQSKLLKLSMISFVKVGPNLAGQIPDVHKSFKEYLPDPVSESFYWLPVTPLEIEDMLKASDQKKACGHDNLPVKLLVDSAQYISNPLSYIPYVPKKITIGLSASITSKVLNESK